ncbi:hypothetical protein SA80RD_86 [Escherichia phage vB_EcoS_SA80RD]|nr:hypothetical protein SA80RD_86 [Escherichia phage vB_EcoS_SA80RD]
MIKHVKQPTLNTCVSACLAMILNKPVEKVIEEFHSRYYNNWEITISEYLTKNGVQHHCSEGGGRETLHMGGLFLCTVPSLNIPGALHQIVIDMTDHKFIVHDPIKGWEGKKFYVGPDQDPEETGAFIIHTWVKDVEILPY